MLIGRYPGAEIAVPSEFRELASEVPAGLPSELLERRPDVMAAEKRVAAAFSRVKEAQAARLPKISLTGSVSDITSELFVLQDRDNPVWSVGGQILAPLFTGGALKAQVEIRTAEQKQAVAQYVQTALKAFGDVENALSSELALRQREAILTAATADAERALELAQTRYRVGSGDLRSVQQQQVAYLSSKMNLLRVQSEQARAAREPPSRARRQFQRRSLTIVQTGASQCSQSSGHSIGCSSSCRSRSRSNMPGI